jgi:hypothetical protein
MQTQNKIDIEFIKEVESRDFRSVSDTGANANALYVWNQVREHVGLPRLKLTDLPQYCEIHHKYHVIQADYGCKVITP